MGASDASGLDGNEACNVSIDFEQAGAAIAAGRASLDLAVVAEGQSPRRR